MTTSETPFSTRFSLYLDGQPMLGLDGRPDIDHAVTVAVDSGKYRDIRVTDRELPGDVEVHTVERRVTVRHEFAAVSA